ncbi:hypothetical protein E2F50_10625 [Rhizobium deserti]|uniref:Uncharacterized protein n=1 Tax=Rhizobium deserti TaxID=2547961 RepID=A0A4R5UK95_9HYPH|nr:hypothetical protein [Rhizobium deserti]TDK37321.1 hypothetical protein E2F50_10625 [Rhizobium deserti]
MNEIVTNPAPAHASRPQLRSLTGKRSPIVFLQAAVDQKEQYQEIMALDDIDYVTQALGIGALLNGAIDTATGRFDAGRARQLIVDFNQALPPADSKYKLAIMNSYQSTVSQENSVVSGMIDKILDVLKTAIGVALGQKSIDQITAAVTDAFTNLKSQDGDAWIFWQKREAHKTVYSYAILFAVQDESTGRVMLAFPMSLEIEVNVEFEKVLWITVKDSHNYSVKVDAMKIAQLLFPKAPGSQTLQSIASAPRLRGLADVEYQTRASDITDITVTNWSQSTLFARAAKGSLVTAGSLQQIMAFEPAIDIPLEPENHYLVHYKLNGEAKQIGMIFNDYLPDSTLWFVSR